MANLERLKELKEMLDNHDTLFKKKNVHFDIHVWVNKPKNKKKLKSCGTAACALGSACLYQPFIKQGLKMIFNPDSDGGDPYCSKRRSHGFDAGVAFFGITRREADFLFSPASYEAWTVNNRFNLKKTFAVTKNKKVKPADVSKRVQFMIDFYTTTPLGSLFTSSF